MAAVHKTISHVRSTSLPTQSHPLLVEVEDHLCRLTSASEATSSASSIYHTLEDLTNLYQNVDDVIQLPITQQTLSQEASRKCAEEVLDRSLRLLDVCSTSKDVLLQLKESVRDLESSLRRKRGAGSDLASDTREYMVSRKNINKMVSKCIKNLKNFEKTYPLTLVDKDNNLVTVVNVLRDVEAMSISSLQSLLCHVSGTQAKSKQNGRSLVSKLMLPKHLACNTEETDLSELEKVDTLLSTLNKQKLSKDVELVKTLTKQLEISELAIGELENGLESLFRCLMKTRVSILNMLT